MTRQFLPDGLLALGFLARLAWWLVCLGWGAL